jgi:DNA replication licensing factor MCM2
MNNNKRSLKDLPSDLNALDDDQDQADEDRNLHLDEEVMEEDVEGENLDDKFDEDYKAIPALDRYDPRDLDDNPVGEDLTQ